MKLKSLDSIGSEGVISTALSHATNHPHVLNSLNTSSEKKPFCTISIHGALLEVLQGLEAKAILD